MRIPRPRTRSSLMRHLRLRTFTAALLLGFALVSLVAYLLPKARAQNEAAAPATRRSEDKKADFVSGELLVRFRPNAAVARNKSRASINVATVTGRTLSVEVNHFGGSDLVEGLRLARVAPEDTHAALQALRARADVAYAEPNFIRQADVVPNDPHYQFLFGLKNSFPGGPGISAESAWDTTTGNHNVVVGIIDSGIDTEHRDLKDNIFVNTAEVAGNNIDDDNNGFVDDVRGWDFVNHDRTVFDNANDDAHGTHVAGTIGARGNNTAGVVGVNWDVQLLPLKAIGPLGATDAMLLEAYNYAKTMRQRGVNLRVLNNSYGGQHFSQSLLDAIKQLGDAGILFVAAAGNDTLNNDFVPHFPGSYDLPNVISVAASSDGGFFASSFSNHGPQSVHLAAPGQNILSTTPRGYSGQGLVAAHTEADGSTYSLFNGTSMATPHVAGAAALAVAANTNITLEKLRAAVLFGVEESGSFSNRVITGGRLNANITVQFALENDVTPPAAPGNFRVESQNGRRIELRWTEAGDDGTATRASLTEIRFTDAVSGEQFRLDSSRPTFPGSERIVFVSIPLQHPAGQFSLRTIDNVGNTSTATVNITVAADVADPYVVSPGAPGALTAQNSGTMVGPIGDDVTSSNITLPFPFPFFGFVTTTVVASSNGALYVPIQPDFALPHPVFGVADFAVATPSNLEGLAMIAGMWSDVRTDRRVTDGVYMVQPDTDRVIFRWQGVTFGTETPVNFEIELRIDGTIQTRYGNGNLNLNPVIVGISGGDPETYLVASHSSESAPLSLTNAQTLTFALRNPPPPPTTDLAVSVTASPNPVISGQNVTYNVRVENLGPSVAQNLVMTDVLPAGTTFVSCTTNFILGTCTGPPVGSTGTVTGRIDLLQPIPSNSGIVFTIVAKITAAPGAALLNIPSATSFRPDPNPSNSSASVTSHVVAEAFFGNTRSIAAGNTHTTSARNDGTVWTWGAGSLGQLGDGNHGIGVRVLTPLPVPGLDGVDAVADGNGFVYALKSNGTVWAWGINGNAQLGDGTDINRFQPVQTPITNVKGIAAGSFYGAAVKTDGTVWVWGAASGLIDNASILRKTPVQLNGIESVTAIAAGAQHLLMLKTDKTVWALGANSMGQLGDGTTTHRLSPVQVNGLSNVTTIAAGEEFSVARKEDGTIWAWGLNRNGQLGPSGGNMTFEAHPNAVQVTGLPAGMSDVSAGSTFCLAIASDGTVWSWGNNDSLQLGQGSDINQNPTPKQIPNFGNVAAVDGGNHHSVALKSDGSVWSWGANFEGELGDGTINMSHLAPARVSGLETVSTPLFDPPAGSFSVLVDVTITCGTPGATIHYTTNGNEPTEADLVIASGSIVRLTNFTILRARAWKPGLIPSGASFSQFVVDPLPIRLLFDEIALPSNQLAAVDAALLVRDPFAVVNPGNQFRNPNDQNTRVMLFVENLPLAPGETAASVVVQLTTQSADVFSINAEDVRPISNLNLMQVTFRLPNNLLPGTCQIIIIAQNRSSNIGTIRIKP